MTFRKIGVVGAGLIGGSIARRCRELHLDVAVFDTRDDLTPHFRELGITSADLTSIVCDSDVLFVCVPLFAIQDVLNEIYSMSEILNSRLKPLVVTDVGSVKECFFHGDTPPRNVQLILGHPMAGREDSGFEQSVATMFDGSTWVLCPGFNEVESAIELTELICAIGARVQFISASDHDRYVAVVSHLQHVIAASSVMTLPHGTAGQVAMRLAASSFRDVTRVASSQPALTSAITTSNFVNVRQAILAFESQLRLIKSMLELPEPERRAQLLHFFSTAHNQRLDYLRARSSVQSLNKTIAQSEFVIEALARGEEGGMITAVEHFGDVIKLTVEL